MVKKEKESTEASQSTEKAVPTADVVKAPPVESAAVIPNEPAPADETQDVPTPEVSQLIKAMNVSATLLHLDDGTPFVPRMVAELTQSEFERFDRFKLIAPK